MTKNSDRIKTIAACYLGLFTQAVVINLSPLFYVIYTTDLNLPLSLIAILPTMVFGIQIFIDALFSRFIAKLGYKFTAVMADTLCLVGLICMGIMPFVPNKTITLIISTLFCSVGSGIIEITTSPLIEAVSGDEKSGAMSFLHSFYCWGHFFVVLLTTAFLSIFGKENWYIMPFITALVPLSGGICYLSINKLHTLEDEGCSNSFKDFGKNRIFVLLMLLMICAGAGEQGIAQWASYFAEKGLNVSKSIGDLAGVCLFAFFMALSRTGYGILGKKLNLTKTLTISAAGLALSYLLTAISPIPLLSLSGIALCGLFVGVMWPGVLSLAGESKLNGGTLMFALMALGGDIGCTLGSSIVGEISANSSMNTGILVGMLFPLCMFILMFVYGKKQKSLNTPL